MTLNHAPGRWSPSPFLILSFALLFCPARASAQSITPRGVQCGDRELTFDELSASTATAAAARLEEIRRTNAYFNTAWSYCEKGTLDPMPGCTALSKWSAARTYPMDNVDERARMLDSDHRMVAAARRVLANDFCKRAEFADDATISACDELSELESRRIPSAALALDVKRLALPPSVPMPDVATCKPKAATVKDINAEVVGAATRVSAASDNFACVRAIAQAKTVLKYAWTKQRYEALDKLAPSDPPIDQRLASAVDRIPFREPELDDSTSVALTDSSYGLIAERNALENIDNRTKCRDATFYVSPDGVVIYQPPPSPEPKAADQIECTTAPPTLCVDSSNFALDRPLFVEVTQYPGAGVLQKDKSGLSSDTARLARTWRAWPGQEISLTIKDSERRSAFLCNAVARITIRGLPRGNSLRAIAQQGSGGLTLGRDSTLADLRAESERVGLAARNAASMAADADSLQALVDGLREKSDYLAKVADLQSKIATADDKQQGPLRTALLVMNTYLMDRLKGFVASDPRGAALSVSTQTFVVQQIVVPSPDAKFEEQKSASVRLVGTVTALAAKATELRAGQQRVADDELKVRNKVSRLCRLANYPTPFVDEDILTYPARAGNYVIDYDFSAGYRGATMKKLKATDHVFIRVRHVKPGYGISVQLDDNGAVQHAPSLIGFNESAKNPPSGELFNRQTVHGTTALGDPDVPIVQPDSTQILSLGNLSEGRYYNLTVNAQPGAQLAAASSAGNTSGVPAGAGASNPSAAANSAPPKDTASQPPRTIGQNTLVSHARRYLGVRAGFGMNSYRDSTKIRTLEQQAGAMGSVVKEHTPSPSFSLPLLLALYVAQFDEWDLRWGRDATSGPPPISVGFVGGIDVMKLTDPPPLYLGAFADVYGFGLTAGISEQLVETVNAAHDTVVATATDVSKSKVFIPGFFLCLTTDLDIFNAVYKSFFSSQKFPGVGAP
jgi:hypothetical protein